MHPKFKIFVNNGPSYDLIDQDLFEYFYLNKFKLNYFHDNIFDFVKQDKNEIVQEFYKNYKSNFNNAKRKFLCDTLLFQNIRTPFCFTDVNNEAYVMSKGNNKLIACAVNNIEYNHILVLLKEHKGLQINNLDELYKCLKTQDPKANSFKIEIDKSILFPFIHIIENEETVRNWFVWDIEYEKLLESCVIDEDSVVVLSGNLQADNTIKNAVFDKQKISNINNFIHTAENYPNFCDYFLFSNKPYCISLNYLEYIQCNLFLKEKIRFGYDKQNNLWIYNRKNVNGINCFINVPNYL